MRDKNKMFLYVIISLIAIGILSKISANPMAYMIPIVVFGIVFYFYKFPPNRRRSTKTSTFRKNDAKRKTSKFRVIEGSKKDEDEESEKPPYH